MGIDAASMLAWDNVVATKVATVVLSASVDAELVKAREAKLLAKVRRQTRKDIRRTAVLVRALNRLVTAEGQTLTQRELPYRTRQHARPHARPVAWNKDTGNGVRSPLPLVVAPPDAHSVGFSYITAVEYTRTLERQRGKALFKADKTVRRAKERAERALLADGGIRNPTLQVTTIASHWA